MQLVPGGVVIGFASVPSSNKTQNTEINFRNEKIRQEPLDIIVSKTGSTAEQKRKSTACTKLCRTCCHTVREIHIITATYNDHYTGCR